MYMYFTNLMVREDYFLFWLFLDIAHVNMSFKNTKVLTASIQTSFIISYCFKFSFKRYHYQIMATKNVILIFLKKNIYLFIIILFYLVVDTWKLPKY